MGCTNRVCSGLALGCLLLLQVDVAEGLSRRLYGLHTTGAPRSVAFPLAVSKTKEDIFEGYRKEVEETGSNGQDSPDMPAAFAATQNEFLARIRPTTPTGRTNLFIITGIAVFVASNLIMLQQNPLKAYEAAVAANPVFVKACTSGVAYGLGDALSQVLLGKKVDDLDLWRSARSGTAGFIGHGPLCHYWMVWMEGHLDFGGAWYAVFAKVVADQTIWSIYLNAMYASIIGFLAGKSLPAVWRDIRDTAWPALRSSWRFWPFIHLISFSKFIPLDLKLLWVDVMEVIWVIILSRVNNEQKIEARVAEGDADEEDLQT